EHMQILNNWRDSVVRDNKRQYVSDTSKRHFNMSLQNECMQCHSNKKKFCDECHNYLAVKPFCWDCHIAPKEDERS
ncbi:MAG TPA: sulfate reduction electron transfer complex DsrMKJOP subunit DsrJ, partial [Nitrospirota bacterium]|nr:sulfate reduction electron transfer complex DsrMKJOP subunit DsrJ [Nitrospirota bacterium]